MRTRGRDNKIVPGLSDIVKREVVESFGGGGGDDGELVHTRMGRVVPTSSHHRRIEQSDRILFSLNEVELDKPDISMSSKMLHY